MVHTSRELVKYRYINKYRYGTHKYLFNVSVDKGVVNTGTKVNV